MTDQHAQDREEILKHIHSIFRAFSNRDEAALLRTHLPDFCGFTVRSRTAIHQREHYLVEIGSHLNAEIYQDYELSDVVFSFRDGVAAVCYVAQLKCRLAQGRETSIKLRVLDVYVREAEGWNLLASNANLHPDEIDQRLSAAVSNCMLLKEAGLL